MEECRRRNRGPAFPEFLHCNISGSRRPKAVRAQPRQSKKPLSALEIRLEQLLGLFEGHFAAVDLSVDEKSRRRVHAELLRPALTHPIDAVEHLLIREAFVEALLVEAQLPGDREQLRQRIANERPLLLGLE